MKKKILCLFMLVSFIFSGFSGSFSDAVKDAAEDVDEEEIVSPSHKHSSNSHTHSSSSSSSSDSSFAELIFDLFGLLWLGTNVGIKYSDYPYQYSDTFGYVTNTNFEDSFGIEDYDTSYLRSYRGSFDSSFFKMGDLGYGNDTKFEAQLWFIGPYFENLMFSDSLNDFSSNYNGNLRLGGQFYLMQTNLVNASFILEWSKWYGNNEMAEILGTGYSLGFDIRSYPIKPLELEWKTAWSGFDNNVGIFESILKGGILFGRTECYLGWRYMSVYNRETDKKSDSWNGISTGIKVYF